MSPVTKVRRSPASSSSVSPEASRRGRQSPSTSGSSGSSGSSPRRRRAGWRIVARKEFADHVRSVRFALLLVIVAIAGLASVHSASSAIRDAAQAAGGDRSVFLYLFTISPDRIPAFNEFIGFLGPLLGIAFGFDAINSERAQRTLPRLVAQPIHRDDVINGKFAAGLIAVALALASVMAIVSGYGIVRLGLTPTVDDAVRLVSFLAVAVVYVAIWLALAMLFSVVARRPATTALATIAIWLLMTFFAGLISGVVADTVHPVKDSNDAVAVLANSRLDQRVRRFSPEELYEESTSVLLDPAARTTDNLVEASQLDQAVPGDLDLADSLGISAGQLLALIAVCALLFVATYLVFVRQEVRA